MQATLGRCNTKQPGMLDMVGRAKWNAWNSLGSLSQVHDMGSVTVCIPLRTVDCITSCSTGKWFRLGKTKLVLFTCGIESVLSGSRVIIGPF